MRSGGSKQKGAGYERKVCQQLSRWLSGGRRKDLFWRSAMSGGRATLAHAKGIKLATQGGDVSAIDPLGAPLTETFCIEIKFYKDLDLAAFLQGKGKLAKFWKQAKVDAKKYGKEPMLIAKQNMQPPLVLVRIGCYIQQDGWTVWRSRKYDLAMGNFDALLKQRFGAPAVGIVRYRPTR